MQSHNELLKKYRHHDYDTGSTEYQIIRLQEKINREKIHLANNKKDIPAKRALLKKIAQQKIFLRYLQKNNPTVYEELKKLK